MSELHSFDDQFINIKNGESQSAIFNTDDIDKMYIGGGKNDRRNFVSDEFANLVGKDIKESQIDDLLREVIDGGVGGVTLENISLESFTLGISANGDTTDYILFKGEAVEDIITGLREEDIIKDFVNIKNGSSQVGVFEFDGSDETTERFFLGGGNNDQRNIVSEEFDGLVAGSKLKDSEVEALYNEAGGAGDGIDGVEFLGGDSSSSFTLSLNANGGTQDIIIFSDVSATV